MAAAFLTGYPKGIPPPPQRPEYDPKEEPPMWDFARLWWGNKIEERAKQFSPLGTQPESPDDPDWRGVVRNEVIEIPAPKPYYLGAPNPDHYFWFDTPDYADPFKKLGWCFKFFATTGVGLVSISAILTGKSFNLENNLYFFRKLIGPYVFGGMAGGVTVITVANLRGKKDDYWNYALGGLAYACAFNSHYPSFVRALTIGTTAALFAKHNAEINGLLYPKFDWRSRCHGTAPRDAEHGIKSGDLRFGFRSTYGDAGRDVRKMY